MSKQDLLLKPCWTYHDVMVYCDCKKSKANEIMKTCREQFNGSVLFNKHAVKRDSVLAYMGTDLEHEAIVLKHVT